MRLTMMGCVAVCSLIGLDAHAQDRAAAWPLIQRTVPPVGIDLAAERVDHLSARLLQLRRRAAHLADHAQLADAECLLKAVDLAIDFNEFYREDHADVAEQILDLADARLKSLAEGASPWRSDKGLVVRGFHSAIDGSAQPIGLEIPDDLDLAKPAVLYVWLHGRGDQTTDLHFIHERLQKRGQIRPANAIVLHPFGRQCIGFKSAGETDVLEAIARVKREYVIDDNRVVLMGFSMGGAGAWHLGAHFADQWVAVSPGAGFAETAEYNNLRPTDQPVWYEQQLWGQYDVPAYARNLFNVPLVAYSGENDKQIQAAQIMERAFATYGRKFTHLIGPGMGHKYHPDTLAEIMTRMDSAVRQGRIPEPDVVELQTRTLKYARMHWVQITRLSEHWSDSTVSAAYDETTKQLRVATKNVEGFRIEFERPIQEFVIDRQTVHNNAQLRPPYLFRRADDPSGKSAWSVVDPTSEFATRTLTKRPGLQGPIDDLFTQPFLVVLPSGKTWHATTQAWIDFEINHLKQRWRSLFRGDLRVKIDSQVTDDDIRDYHLLLWGDPHGNQFIKKIVARLPLTWNQDQVGVGRGPSSDAAAALPVLIYPNPVNQDRYVVLNSGPTFREAHDRTNSLQNPKLPDWALLDVRGAPNATQAGDVLAAGFFNEDWQPISQAAADTETE